MNTKELRQKDVTALEAAGRAFGMPPGAGGASGAPGAADLDPSKLPPGFEKFLGR